MLFSRKKEKYLSVAKNNVNRCKGIRGNIAKLIYEKGAMINMENDKIQLFEDKRIRTVWDEEQEEWYFSIVDVVAVLTDSVDPKQYIKKMRTRDPELNNNWGTICTPVQMVAVDGKKRKIQAAAI